MKKCKILKFKRVMETFLDSSEEMVSGHSKAEKLVEEYLNDGYEIKGFQYDGTSYGCMAIILEKEI